MKSFLPVLTSVASGARTVSGLSHELEHAHPQVRWGRCHHSASMAIYRLCVILRNGSFSPLSPSGFLSRVLMDFITQGPCNAIFRPHRAKEQSGHADIQGLQTHILVGARQRHTGVKCAGQGYREYVDVGLCPNTTIKGAAPAQASRFLYVDNGSSVARSFHFSIKTKNIMFSGNLLTFKCWELILKSN